MSHLPAALIEPEDGLQTRMRFRLSASQLKMFHPDSGGCPRKWALHYLARVPRIPNQALADGIRLHECIADLFTLGATAWEQKWPVFVAPDATSDAHARAKTAQLALAMAEQAPAGKMPPTVEGTDMLEVPELDTAFYIKPDWTRDHAVFLDWKSTGAPNFRSPFCLHDTALWPDGVVPETIFFRGERHRVHWLKNDIQARLYAYGLMQLWHEVRVKARWVYGSKGFELGQRPRVWIVEHTFERAETRDWVEKHIWPIARTMNTIRAAFESGRLDSALLVPHAAESCGYTGRFCDGLGVCGFQASPVPMKKLALPVLPA